MKPFPVPSSHRITPIAVALLMTATLLVPIVQASPLDSPRHFSDSDYHEFVLYDLDQTSLDILILPSASPYALRELALIQQSLQTWQDGIQNLAPPWLRNGLTLQAYTLGIDPIPASALWDPEIIIVSSEFNPAALLGAGIEPMNFFGAYLCHEQAPPRVPTNEELTQIPGFHGHAGTGMARTECENGGNTCFVVNSNILWLPDDANRRDMADLVSHEIGHCLGLGHIGDALDFTAAAYPRNDVMSYEADGHDAGRTLCPSTLNMRVLQQIYGNLLGQPDFPVSPAGSYITMHPADWRTSNCLEPTATHTDTGPLLTADPLAQTPNPPARQEPELNITSPVNGAELHGNALVVSGTVDRGNSKPKPISPLPEPSPGYVGFTWAYQHVEFPTTVPTLGDSYGVGASNLAAFATTLIGDPVPKYPAGSLVDLALREASGDNLQTNLPGSFTLLNEDGDPIDAPLEATGAPDDSGLQWNANHPYTLPSKAGRYYIAVHITLANGQEVLFSDPSYTGLKPIDILDPANTGPIGSALDVSPDPSNDGAVPLILGEVGDATITDNDGDLVVTLHIPGLLDAFTPGPNGNPYVYQVSFKTAHNGVPQDYLLQYTYESNPNPLVIGKDTFALQVLSSASTTGLRSQCLVNGNLPGSSYTASTAVAKWVVKLSEFNHDNRAAQNNCEGFTRNGRGFAAGDILRDITGSASLKLATLQTNPPQDQTTPVPYTIRSGKAPSLQADAGTTYHGRSGTPIPIHGSAIDAAGAYTCAWSSPGAAFADPAACTTTVTYATVGTHVLDFTVTDSTGASATDSATITTTAPPPPERIQVTLADRNATVPVDTTMGAPAAWNVSLDLTGLAIGAYTLTATWIDGDGTLVDSQSIALNLSNHPPKIWLPGDQTVAEAAQLTFTVSATDPDATDTVSLMASDLPRGATFNTNTGGFEWTPDHDQAGNYTITFTASDRNGGTAAASLTIHVADTDRAPLLDPIANITAKAHTEIRFTLHAVDPDGQTVTYTATKLPTGATLDSITGEFHWKPTHRQTGDHTITFQATAGALQDTQGVHFTITQRPSSPLRPSESHKEN